MITWYVISGVWSFSIWCTKGLGDLMSWNQQVKKHYENVSKTYDVLNIINNDEISLKNGLREVIVDEMKLSCECVIAGIADVENNNYKTASAFLETLKSGYDIRVIIDVRNFIYKLI